MDKNSLNSKILKELIVSRLCIYFQCQRDTCLYIKHEDDSITSYNDNSWSQITPECMAHIITEYLDY